MSELNGMKAQRGGLAIDGLIVDDSKNLSLPPATSSLITPVLLTGTKVRVHGFTLHLLHLGDDQVQITWGFRQGTAGEAMWLQHQFGVEVEMLRVIFRDSVTPNAQAVAYLEEIFLHALGTLALGLEIDFVALVRDIYGLRLGQMAAAAQLDVAGFLAQFLPAPADAEEPS